MEYLMRPAPPLLSDLLAEELVLGPATRKELCEKLGVSRTSLGRAISELAADGSLLSSIEGQRTVPGRPVQKLALNTRAGYRVGIDISRSGCYAVVLNRVYQELFHVETKNPAGMHWADALHSVCQRLFDVSADQGIALDSVSKVGVGIPVPINEDSREYQARKEQIGKLLHAYWSASILLENTVRLGAIGEARWGASRGISSQFYVRLSMGGWRLLGNLRYHYWRKGRFGRRVRTYSSAGSE